MRRIWLVLSAAFMADGAPANAQGLDISAVLEARYAFGTQSGRSQSAELEFRPKWDLAFSDAWEFRGEVRIRADAFDRLEVGRPSQETISALTKRVLIGQSTEIELREAYLQYSGDLSTVRIGKQQIVWGRSDGIKVLDIVNPQSYREFVLDDFDQSRTPLWSLLLERTIGGLDFQGFWIPDRSFNEAPPRGSVFEITAPEFVPTFWQAPPYPVSLQETERPQGGLDASEVGFKVSGLIGNWDFSLNYLHTFEDTPFFDLEIVPPALAITPQFNRVDILGGSVANSWGDFTVRGEATYTMDANIPVGLLPSDTLTPARADVFKYLIGIDYFGIPDTFVSAQFFQKINMSKVPNALSPDVEELSTVTVRHDLPGGDWQLDFRWYANHDSNDGLFRMLAKRRINDRMTASVGGDFFYGRKDGIFGQFGEADRVYFSVAYHY
ncbi:MULTISPECIES: DUF1302 family protein [Kordiimonas]|uniref:DUF1302 family protein n=1 Tax=Kordiimonas TaxID=288021 RepID=UPI00258098B0|nr:DUF1302 family protein [Kordiimonas sp. UBA4487]